MHTEQLNLSELFETSSKKMLRVAGLSSIVGIRGVKAVCLNSNYWTVLARLEKQHWSNLQNNSFFKIPNLWGKVFEIVYFPNVWFVQTDFKLFMPFALHSLASIPEREGKTESNDSLTLPFCLSARHIGHSCVHQRHNGLTTIFSCQRESSMLLLLLLSGALLRGRAREQRYSLKMLSR